MPAVSTMDEALVTQPTTKLCFSDQIHCVELSPYEWSQHLICIALSQEIIVGTVHFQDEDELIEDISYKPLRTFHHDTRVHTIAWSPDTSLSVVPKIVSFCAAGADFKIRLYNSNLNDVHVYEILESHKDYINDLSYESEGELLASVSDDHTCKLWAVKEEQKYVTSFYLTSPGMSVCWHTEESGKLLVAEKNGLIHMYNVRSQQAIMSLDAGVIPLTCADWGPNPLKVVCLASGELLLWDVSRPSRPTESRTLHIEGGLSVKFARGNENLVASLGRPDNLVKVTNLRTKQVVMCGKVRLVGSITWHHKLPYLCAANDRELFFWRLNSK
ncbi:nucleoporin Nup37 [Venturia canescens]|uniref:nucleoporin Nup37 n=1 Tax=Venturia canescens TaxID=32260 RepID=UPI001C9C4972|nr:nucleoporin Nup37 [Venturia canescens]